MTKETKFRKYMLYNNQGESGIIVCNNKEWDNLDEDYKKELLNMLKKRVYNMSLELSIDVIAEALNQLDERISKLEKRIKDVNRIR